MSVSQRGSAERIKIKEKEIWLIVKNVGAQNPAGVITIHQTDRALVRNVVVLNHVDVTNILSEADNQRCG